jgi:predicted DNA-binding ribbon-helix-helix protein
MFKISSGYDTVTRTIRIPEYMYSKLSRLASNNKISVNQLIVQCIDYSLNNLQEDPKGSEPTTDPEKPIK